MPAPGAEGTPPELRAWLVSALRRRAPRFPGDIADGTPLTDGGLCLDSLTLMDLLAEIEETFGVALSEADITPANFGTPGRLLRFLRGRMS